MRFFQRRMLVIFCCVICCGCGSAKLDALTAEVESLKGRVAAVEAEKAQLETEKASLATENAKLQSDLEKARQDLAKIEPIKKGWETARTKLNESMKQLAPLLGSSESPLPPFEELKDSSWVGKFAPGAKMPAGLKDIKALENELKGRLGDQGMLPGVKPKN